MGRTRKKSKGKKGAIKKIIVKKILSDEDTMKLSGERLPKGYFKKIIRENADVYTEDGDILIRFRKNVLPLNHINDAYEAIISFAKKKTTTRGMAAGNNGKRKVVQNNDRIRSNIIGYYDTLSIKQHQTFKLAKMKKPICRPTKFTGAFPSKMEKVIPLIKDIDEQYKSLFPRHHAIQYKAAQSTKYVIDDTAFSTITTNLNFQTACHHDRGDFQKGFGNLVVIEKGKYKGGYIGFPQYGVGVDIRQGDFLGMDVHQIHGNEPIMFEGRGEAQRLSLVSYLREEIVRKCQNEPLYDYSYFEEASKKAAKILAKDPGAKKPGPKKGFKKRRKTLKTKN